MTEKYRYDNQEILKYVGAVVLTVSIILNESGLGQIESLILASAVGKFLLNMMDFINCRYAGQAEERKPELNI